MLASRIWGLSRGSDNVLRDTCAFAWRAAQYRGEKSMYLKGGGIGYGEGRICGARWCMNAGALVKNKGGAHAALVGC